MQILVNIMFEGTHTFDNKRAINLHSFDDFLLDSQEAL